MTVSRVVNRSGPVSETVRLRVERAINELGYVPSRLARGLRSSRTHTIALIVSDVRNPFFTTIARGAEDAASNRDYLLMLCNTDESEEKETRYLEMLMGQNVDGVLLVPSKTAERATALAKRAQFPLVLLERRIPDRNHSIVLCDTQAGSRQMAEHLLGLGHRVFAILASPVGVAVSDERIRGALEVIEGAGGRATILSESLSRESADRAVDRWLALEPRPTAIFALNNLLTFGLVKALRARGLRIPEDVSVAGFDDLPPHLLEQPFLTVVSQPAYEMGRRSVELLFDLIENPSSAPTEVLLQPELLIRLSCGQPPLV